MKLREKTWLWGHPAGRYNNEFGNNRESRMTPMECCLYLGIRNTFMIPVGWKANRRQYNKAFTTLRSVAWECYGAAKNPDEVDPLIKEAADFPNIHGVVFDDFQRGGWPEYTKIPVENLWEVNRRLHNNDVRDMAMWMVLYTREFANDPNDPNRKGYNDELFAPYIEPFDGLILWTWDERDVPLIPEKYEAFKKMCAGKRHMVGLYLYNFGENRDATAEAVKWQLDFWYDKLKSGEIEGIVFHTNTMADLDLEAYDVAKAWMEEHGDEEIPD